MAVSLLDQCDPFEFWYTVIIVNKKNASTNTLKLWVYRKFWWSFSFLKSETTNLRMICWYFGTSIRTEVFTLAVSGQNPLHICAIVTSFPRSQQPCNDPCPESGFCRALPAERLHRGSHGPGLCPPRLLSFGLCRWSRQPHGLADHVQRKQNPVSLNWVDARHRAAGIICPKFIFMHVFWAHFWLKRQENQWCHIYSSVAALCFCWKCIHVKK